MCLFFVANHELFCRKNFIQKSGCRKDLDIYKFCLFPDTSAPIGLGQFQLEYCSLTHLTQSPLTLVIYYIHICTIASWQCHTSMCQLINILFMELGGRPSYHFIFTEAHVTQNRYFVSLKYLKICKNMKIKSHKNMRGNVNCI